MIQSYQQIDLLEKKVFEKAVIQPPFRLTASFPDEACFYFLIKGNASVLTPTQAIEMQTDEGLVMQCGTYFNDYFQQEEIPYCEAIAVHLYPEIIKEIYEKELPQLFDHMSQSPPIGQRKVTSTPSLRSYVESLHFYFENPHLAHEDLIKVKLKELIMLLAQTEDALAIKAFISGLFNQSEVSLREVIEANLYHNLSLEDLASLAGMSLSTFKREFTKHYQASPARYIRSKKIEKAARLLRDTQMRISDIAFDCGFNDLPHFSKTFQKDMGCSPSEYRLSQNDKSLD